MERLDGTHIRLPHPKSLQSHVCRGDPETDATDPRLVFANYGRKKEREMKNFLDNLYFESNKPITALHDYISSKTFSTYKTFFIFFIFFKTLFYLL